MDRNHSRLIIILLAGILFVMLAGRETANEFIGSAFWIALIIGALVLIVWTLIALIPFTRREVRLYREEVDRDRREGKPWLYTFVAWPGIIGNFAIVGIAGFDYLNNLNAWSKFRFGGFRPLSCF